MLQSPGNGGEFEYREKVRNSEKGDSAFADTEAVIKGKKWTLELTDP